MDYIDPEEEFELMHAEELEMMRELEGALSIFLENNTGLLPLIRCQ